MKSKHAPRGAPTQAALKHRESTQAALDRYCDRVRRERGDDTDINRRLAGWVREGWAKLNPPSRARIQRAIEAMTPDAPLDADLRERWRRLNMAQRALVAADVMVTVRDPRARGLDAVITEVVRRLDGGSK